jgi:Fe-S cluster assembly iron-binding protein IscA
MVLDEPKDGDDVYKVNSFTMVMDKELYKRTKDVTVDYVNYGFGAGFKLTCEVPISNGGGCGSSCSC